MQTLHVCHIYIYIHAYIDPPKPAQGRHIWHTWSVWVFQMLHVCNTWLHGPLNGGPDKAITPWVIFRSRTGVNPQPRMKMFLFVSRLPLTHPPMSSGRIHAAAWTSCRSSHGDGQVRMERPDRGGYQDGDRADVGHRRSFGSQMTD